MFGCIFAKIKQKPNGAYQAQSERDAVLKIRGKTEHLMDISSLISVLYAFKYLWKTTLQNMDVLCISKSGYQCTNIQTICKFLLFLFLVPVQTAFCLFHKHF